MTWSATCDIYSVYIWTSLYIPIFSHVFAPFFYQVGLDVHVILLRFLWLNLSWPKCAKCCFFNLFFLFLFIVWASFLLCVSHFLVELPCEGWLKFFDLTWIDFWLDFWLDLWLDFWLDLWLDFLMHSSLSPSSIHASVPKTLREVRPSGETVEIICFVTLSLYSSL